MNAWCVAAQVVPITFPDLEMARVAQLVTVGAELAQVYKRFLANRHLQHFLGPDTRTTLRVASCFTATDFLQVEWSLNAFDVHAVLYRAKLRGLSSA